VDAKRRRSLVKLLVLVAFVTGAVAFFRYAPVGLAVTPTNVRETIDEFDPVSARLLYVAFYVVGTVLLLPGTVLSFAGAVLFGVWEGTLYTWIGATIGATLAFLLSKALGRDFINGLLGGRLQALDQRLRDHGFTGLLILRLVPIFPFNGINFGAGITSIGMRDYVLATALGILPGTFVYQLLFARLGDKILHDGLAWDDLLDPVLGIALGLFVAFILVGKWISTKLRTNTM
jgi:uncharacterized membrane protein YdjX (TVP38/TMEM64 family)